MATWISGGRFGRPHGLRGEVRLWPHNPDTSLIAAGRSIWIGKTSDSLEKMSIRSTRNDAKGLLVHFNEVNNRDDAQRLNHLEWFIDREELPDLQEDEFYFTDLMGATGELDDGIIIGSVTDIIEAGAGEVLVFNGPHGEVMVPFVPAFILDLNLESKHIKIRAVKGLLEGGL